ncbi:Flp pilus assembly complex ATPase component TadA [bacterium]|nr:Flp pilus assembly complex ATPase component TadA [bacterium]
MTSHQEGTARPLSEDRLRRTPSYPKKEAVTSVQTNAPRHQFALVQQLKLAFRGGAVELIPSEQWKTLRCNLCGAETHFYTNDRRKNTPLPSCLDCSMRKPQPQMGSKALIGDILRNNGVIGMDQIRLILERQKTESAYGKVRRKFADYAVEMGLCTVEQAAAALTEIYQFEYVDLQGYPVANEHIQLLARDLCHKHKVICIGKKNQIFQIAMVDPTDEQALVAIAQMLERQFITLTPFLADKKAIDDKLGSYDEKGVELLDAPTTDKVLALRGQRQSVLSARNRSTTALQGKIIDQDSTLPDEDIEEIADISEEIEALQTVLPEDVILAEYKKILAEGFRRGASDIHLEFLDQNRFMVRYRIDGILYPPRRMPKDYGRILNIVKVDGNIDTGDREDQVYEGSFAKGFRKKRYRLRVEFLPTFIGGKCMPKCILRIFDPDSQAKNLDELGFDARTRELLQKAAAFPNGMVLVAGSTGMGKSTTLSAIMREKAEDFRLMIYSLENPIEYTVQGVNQIQIETSAKMKHRSYHSILPAIQRSDPNVVLVGEIRDRITAAASYRLAIGGNLVFGTIHASDSPGVVTRLRNFQIERFLIGDSTRLIISQRLVRKLCRECRTRVVISAKVIRDAGFYFRPNRDVEVWEASREGCDHCTQGYKGRTVIAEAMPITPLLRAMIIEGKDEGKIRHTAIKEGMITLRQSGLAHVLDGVTSISEVHRVTGDFPDPTIEVMTSSEQRPNCDGEDILQNVRQLPLPGMQ